MDASCCWFRRYNSLNYLAKPKQYSLQFIFFFKHKTPSSRNVVVLLVSCTSVNVLCFIFERPGAAWYPYIQHSPNREWWERNLWRLISFWPRLSEADGRMPIKFQWLWLMSLKYDVMKSWFLNVYLKSDSIWILCCSSPRIFLLCSVALLHAPSA